jgi:hypothetical protein
VWSTALLSDLLREILVNFAGMARALGPGMRSYFCTSTSVLAFVALGAFVACGGDSLPDPDETEQARDDALTLTILRPIADVGTWQVEGVDQGAVVTTSLYALVDEATADNATSMVRIAPGFSTGSHRTRFGAGPSGAVSQVSVGFRARRGTTAGSVQAVLFQGSTQVAAGPVHSLSASGEAQWIDFQDSFQVNLPNANNLETRIILGNSGGTGGTRYTQVYLEVQTQPSTRSPAGAWAIRQVSSLADLNGATSQINTALDTPGIVGFGLRVPVNVLLPAQGVFDSTILDQGLAIAGAKGKKFKPRVIWGKYTPTWASGPKFTDANGSAPIPFLSNGSPNTTFESAYQFLIQSEVAWASSRPDVMMLDCGWYSLNYSELYFGPGVQQAYGASSAVNEGRFIAAHQRLIDIAFAATGGGVPVGFGLSGHGPIGNIAPALAAHMEDKGPDSERIFMQANGWGPNGEWGGALESSLDASVWPKDVKRAVQDISPQACRSASNWQTMFGSAHSLGTTYIELYTYQWALGSMNCNQAAFDAMKAQIALFTPVP